MKKQFRKIGAWLAALLLVLSAAWTPVRAETDTGYEINQYDVQVDISEKGVYTVTETLQVHFNELRHGIYLNVASDYTNYTWDTDGKRTTMNYHFPISNVEILSSQDSSIDYQSEGVQIQLGSADYYADSDETYKVRYQIHTKDLGLDGKQMLYWNLISTNWNTEIHSSSFTIHMPKEFDASSLKFYTDGQEMDPALQYSVSGNTISGSLNTDIVNGRGITVWMDLPDGYFDYAVSASGSYIIAGISAALTALFVFLFLKFGRDSRVITTIEFTAPKELTSAGVGYVFDGNADSRDVASLILDWANSGYIQIEDSKKDLTLHKLQDLPEDAHSYEKHFFAAIFKNGDTRTTDSMAHSMYESFMQAKSEIPSYYNEKGHRIYASGSRGFQTVAILCTGIPLAALSGYCEYMYEYSAALAILMGILPMALMIVAAAMASNVQKKWHTGHHFGKICTLIGSVFLVLIAYAYTMMVAVNSEAAASWVLILVMACSAAIMVLGVFMVKLSPFGVSMLGKVRGLYQFIVTAEKDRLDMMAKDDPQIFYRILPYAYALNLTQVWKEHFKNMEIPQPSWYYGDHFETYYFLNRMDSRLNEVSHPIPPVSASSSGGFSGGGFSGGGGGFSGGGFGGSSGGSW